MKVKDAFKTIMAGEASREKFMKNPVGTLKEHGVDTDALPPDVLDKIAGAGSSTGKKTEGVTTGVTIGISISSI